MSRSRPIPFKGFVALLRPTQWTKNLVCLSGAFFAGHIRNPQIAGRGVLAVLAFCATASLVYVLNDIVDRERDRNHPQKKSRPIASGQVSVPQAFALAGVLLVPAMAIGASLGANVLALLGGYVVMNLAYSFTLKHVPLLDGMVVALGFILRIYVGTEAAGVLPSAWILLCTLFFSLFLAFGKRRAELNALGADAAATRGVIRQYNVIMLDRFCNICVTLVIATYALFTVLSHPDHSLILTTPPVVFGLFRYLLLVEREEVGEAPDVVLLTDRPIQLAILVWFSLYVAVLYFGLRIHVQ